MKYNRALMYKFKIANKNIFAASVDQQDPVVLQEIKLYSEQEE